MIIISSFVLKIIALVTMTLDHVGVILFNNNSILRLVGRIAFPIYCFLLVQGYIHTKNDKKRLLKYAGRLFVFALISEIPYNLVINGTIFFPGGQNTLFTLFLGLTALCVFDYLKPTSKLLSLFSVMSIALFSLALNSDYSIWGVLLIFMIYLYTEYKYLLLLITPLIFMAFFKDILFASNFSYALLVANSGILLSLPFILNYNGQKGYYSKEFKYFFYIYYPLHIFLLYEISLL